MFIRIYFVICFAVSSSAWLTVIPWPFVYQLFLSLVAYSFKQTELVGWRMHTLILLGIRTKRVGNYSHPHSIGTTPAGWGGGIRDVQEVWTLTLDGVLRINMVWSSFVTRLMMTRRRKEEKKERKGHSGAMPFHGFAKNIYLLTQISDYIFPANYLVFSNYCFCFVNV